MIGTPLPARGAVVFSSIPPLLPGEETKVAARDPTLLLTFNTASWSLIENLTSFKYSLSLTSNTFALSKLILVAHMASEGRGLLKENGRVV